MKQILYLLKQKKIWREKLICIINCRIFDLKELKRIEMEEAVKSIQTEPSTSGK